MSPSQGSAQGLGRRSRSVIPASSLPFTTEESAGPDNVVPIHSCRLGEGTAALKDNASISSSRQWDVDLWKKVKRCRPDHSSPPLFGPDTCSSRPLPSTAAAFNLPPRQTIRKRKSRTVSPVSTSSPHTLYPAPTSSPNSAAVVDGLYSNAFGELRRSIAEHDEGFVQRMREMESVRADIMDSQPSPTTGDHRGRPPAHRMQSIRSYSCQEENMQNDSEEDDVLILEDRPSSPPSKRARSGPHLELDFQSDGVMDVDMDVSFESEGQHTSAATNTTTPALSHTISSSPGSSIASLPLPGPNDSIPLLPTSHPTSTNIPPYSSTSQLVPSIAPPASGSPPPASREEKAVAALSLALAHGAGMNDYGAVREAQESLGGTALNADHDIGDLWH